MQALLGSAIGAAAVLIVAVLSFALNRKLQIEAAWRSEKLEYYKELIDSLAQNVEGMATVETHREFARASNNLLLVGSPAVLSAHQAYREHIAESNSRRDYSLDEGLLAALINAIRSDLRIPGGAVLTDDQARLWTSRRRIEA